MNISQFIEQYFVKPIIEHTGYNLVNTLVYAVIAIVAAFVIYKYMKPRFDKRFLIYVIPFILLGSTVRVVTDSIDTGVAQQYMDHHLIAAVVKSHIYDYGYWTVTPGIYILIAAITLFSFFISDLLKKPRLFPLIGLLLWIPHLMILVPMMSNVSFFLLILLIACIATGISAVILKKVKIKNLQSKLAVFAHALDGGATFTAISIFNLFSSECTLLGKCYAEQHVVGRFFAGLDMYGMLLYLLIKVVFAIAACWVIEREATNKKEKNFIYLIIIIFGLAPGVRDALRLLVGA